MVFCEVTRARKPAKTGVENTSMVAVMSVLCIAEATTFIVGWPMTGWAADCSVMDGLNTIGCAATAPAGFVGANSHHCVVETEAAAGALGNDLRRPVAPVARITPVEVSAAWGGAAYAM